MRTKVTDLLIKYANFALRKQNCEEIQEQIYSRYAQIGEYFSLSMQGLKVRLLTPRQARLIVTGSPNDAIVNPETYINLHNLQLDPDEKIIFPGFYEIAPSGNVATFSRGRSDITGVSLARGFNAELYENFIDVDAIFSANPVIVSNPDPISKITYREMPGAMIVPETNFKAQHTITGIAGGKNVSALYLHKYLLNKGAGFNLKILQILDHHNVAYEYIPSGIDDITIIFKKEDLNTKLIDQIYNEVQLSLNPDQIQWIADYAITMVVGEGMRDKLTLCASILYPLGQKDISIQMINQGAFQISIMIGTKRQDAEEVIRTIYQTFFN
ncbi:ACT domain-containing protein [Lactobacillus taiwanensis]|uniref:ACT domain-containing protein n=1 Tax=Lactobacillus taiwanensis TaxID=508451 RepID=UPI000B97F014|nr:aspartate kinase [Lactobacillus taiwanensis]OYR99343.1 aspartate kinase [Lactobacillus taiwanensis]OYS16785.1 aspartate kinase [Lactobacillus taiwanensis]OYS32231.1 aspartate kinase [Lactobacillus taiwanensis]OYS32860.1 aspartate kinase [Lactobacillus taiwanensis]